MSLYVGSEWYLVPYYPTATPSYKPCSVDRTAVSSAIIYY